MSIKDDWYCEQNAVGRFLWFYHFSRGRLNIHPVVFPGDTRWKFVVRRPRGTTWETLHEGEGDTLELTMEAALCAWRDELVKEARK